MAAPRVARERPSPLLELGRAVIATGAAATDGSKGLHGKKNQKPTQSQNTCVNIDIYYRTGGWRCRAAHLEDCADLGRDEPLIESTAAAAAAVAAANGDANNATGDVMERARLLLVLLVARLCDSEVTIATGCTFMASGCNIFKVLSCLGSLTARCSNWRNHLIWRLSTATTKRVDAKAGQRSPIETRE